MDRRKFNKGTKGNRGGRAPKTDEQKRIEMLGPLEAEAVEALKAGLTKKEPWAVKLFFDYFYSKPTQRTDVNMTGDVNIDPKEFIT